MNKKRIENRWKRHHEKQEWQKETEQEIEKILNRATRRIMSEKVEVVLIGHINENI